jgi:hypothetical protein
MGHGRKSLLTKPYLQSLTSQDIHLETMVASEKPGDFAINHLESRQN